MEAKAATPHPDSASAPRASEVPAKRCPNCGTALRGRFCHACGQKQRNRIQPLGALVRDGISTFLSLDFRIVSTLRRLLFAPGRLTEAYLHGQRARFTKPFRLYLLVSAAYFLTQALVVQDGVFFGGLLKDPGESAGGFQRWLPRLMFVLVPAFALLMKLFYLRQRRFYVEHLIFSLHYFGFYFALNTLLAPLPMLGALVSATWLRVSLLVVAVGFGIIAPAVYLFLALRRAWGQSRLWSGAKAAGLYVGWLAMLALSVAALGNAGVIG